jgi:hypothetical protein
MSNETKQTAVEWLAEQMLYPEFANPYIEQAKEMEKQQIIKAWKAGDGQHDKVADKLAEQWYEKTYGGNK